MGLERKPTMATHETCPRCREELPADAPEGLCPECLFRQSVVNHGQGQTRRGRPGPTSAALCRPRRRTWPTTSRTWRSWSASERGAWERSTARQPALDRLVALKVLPQEVARDPAFAERFCREARSLARFNHPNIVTIYDFGETGGFCYIIMEFVAGKSLRQLLQAGRQRRPDAPHRDTSVRRPPIRP